MNILAFLATVGAAGGVARANKFQVNIYTANLIANGGAAAAWMTHFAELDGTFGASRLVMTCCKAEIPSYQFQTGTQRLYGPAFKFPHLPEYQDLVLSFYMGADMNERYFFDAWMYMIMDPVTNDFNYIAEFTTNIDIIQYDDNDQATYITTLVEAYPTSVASVPLAWEDMNATERLDVTITFKFATPFEGKGGNAAFGVRGNQILFQNTVTGPGGGVAPPPVRIGP